MEALPLVQDKAYLKHFWHPVCTLREFEQADASGAGPMAVRLLGQDVVLARLGERLVAMRDRCAHRGARLSLGRVRDEQLECPYHGWAYDDGGTCRHIPACPDMKIPGKARVAAFDCEVRYDIVWVRLDSSYDATAIPLFSDWDTGMRVVVAESYVWKTSAERRWENFTDFSHFAFVHPGTLYDEAYARPPVVPVDRVDGELRFCIEPPKAMLESLPEASPLGAFSYRCTMPFTINLEIALYRRPERYVLWTTSCPVDEGVCRNFMIIARQSDDESDDAHLAFQKRVLAEDQPVIESQSPAEPAMDEVSVITDKVSLQYRKWLRELGAAAGAGQQAFLECLNTNVIESDKPATEPASPAARCA